MCEVLAIRRTLLPGCVSRGMEISSGSLVHVKDRAVAAIVGRSRMVSSSRHDRGA